MGLPVKSADASTHAASHYGRWERHSCGSSVFSKVVHCGSFILNLVAASRATRFNTIAGKSNSTTAGAMSNLDSSPAQLLYATERPMDSELASVPVAKQELVVSRLTVQRGTQTSCLLRVFHNGSRPHDAVRPQSAR